MTVALKEWSIIVDALGKGKQSILLRKGGIREEGDEFEAKHKTFLLYPTIYHEQEKFIKPDWLPFLNGAQYVQNAQQVLIKYYAEVADYRMLESWDVVAKLNAWHAWKEEVIKERFERWGNRIHLLILQIYELPSSVKIDVLPQYGGCTSWIEIQDDIPLNGKPVVNKNII
ncbi:MAG: DUF1802 family protein [Cytophagaceae bacterium]|nr:DUF1802 family protein [Cytophagaceae bacterium]MDW8457308.1 DUF1802 family protein [Cytophagaceae bacterium]